jgi:hypothetical protein
MNLNEIENDKIKLSLIKIESLQKEYEVTLQQYQEAGQNYINAIKINNTIKVPTQNTNSFIALAGRTWWGTKGLTEGPANSQEECETMCANSDQCSGATFNPVKKYCWTRTGESDITVGQDSDYALITKQREALSIMKYLNDRLLSLNDEIAYEFKNINPEVKEQYEAKQQKQQQLNASYSQLLEQKRELETQLREYNSIGEKESNQSTYVVQQNMSYNFWVLIAGFVLFITIKRMIGVSVSPISISIWFIIILLLVMLSYNLSTPAGFLVWFGFLVAIITRWII